MKRNVFLCIVIAAALLAFQGCSGRGNRSADELVSYYRSRGHRVENVIDLRALPDTRVIAERMGGRTYSFDVDGIEVMVIEKESEAAAQSHVEREKSAPAPGGVEELRRVPYANRNLVLLVGGAEVGKKGAQKIISEFQEFR